MKIPTFFHILNLWQSVLLVLSCFSLTACVQPLPILNFPHFPIAGYNGEYGEYFPLSRQTRYIYSFICYVLLAATLATIPMCFTKFFKDPIFFKRYNLFWVIAAYFYTLLLAALTGIMPNSVSGCLDFLATYTLVLCVTLIPAYIRRKFAHKL